MNGVVRPWYLPDEAEERRGLRQRVVVVLRVLLGLLFLLTGLSKVAALPEFEGAVAKILGWSADAAAIGAAWVAGMEIVGGAALLSGYRLRVFGVMLIMLTLLFIVVLGAAILGGDAVTCGCFGALGIALSNTSQLVVDVMLLNLLVVLVLLSRPRRGPRLSAGERVGLLVLVAAALVLEADVLASFLGGVPRPRGPDVSPLVDLAAGECSEFGSVGGRNRLVMVLRVADLHCALCHEDLLRFCEGICRVLPEGQLGRVVVLLGREEAVVPRPSGRWARWAREAGIPFPLVVTPEETLERLGFTRSAVAVVNPESRTLAYQELPLGPGRLGQIVRLMSP